MSDRDEEQRGVRIVDRRRFDAEGNDRDDEQVGSTSKSSAREMRAQAPRGSPAQGGNLPGGDRERGEAVHSEDGMPRSSTATGAGGDAAHAMHDPDITFSSFVMSLATQALMQLGEVAPPPGMEINVDRESAKHTIDILGMLHRKFGVGLEREESQLLDDILHNLRMAYVRRP